jgi:CRISPR/Cas system-associated exonuclease Cas4 (RecB family)
MGKGLVKSIKKVVKQEENQEGIKADQVVEYLHQGYESGNGTKFLKRDSFMPSTLVYGPGHCPRYWYLYFEGNEAEVHNDWYSIANMNSGTDRHKRIENAFDDAGILVTKEYPIKNERPKISGRTDAVINIDGQEILTEIKTKGNEGFERTLRPPKYNIEQLLIYMKIRQDKDALLLIENKDTHQIKNFVISVNQKYKDFINYLFDWMIRIEDAFEAKTIPKNPYRNKFENKNCKSCQFLKACQQKPEGDIKIEHRKELE